MATPWTSMAARPGLQSELTDLRRELLPRFLMLALPLVLFWHLYTFFAHRAFGPYDLPVALLPAACLLALWLNHRSQALACWAYLGGLVLSYRVILPYAPPQLGMALGGLIVISANALLGARGGLVVASVVAVVGILTPWGRSVTEGWWPAVVAFATYLVLAAAWLAGRPFETAIDWALGGWKQATDMLLEARERRAELSRLLHALEEATFRIERMNNELIVARREAEEARALKSRFVAIVSHELRGPLNLVLGFAKLMALAPESYGEPLPLSYRQDMYTVFRTAEHLSSLVDDVLDLSQVEAQKLPLMPERAAVEQDIVSPIVDMVRPLAERKGLRLVRRASEGLPEVIVDIVRLRQVLLNLLTNAIRATVHGQVAVVTSAERDAVRVSVIDTGPGIAPEAQAKLFEEFSRIRRDAKEAGTGSGLGLAISKHLVELHGGRIWVESEPGKGTAVHFTVPLPGTALLVPTQRPLEHRAPRGPKPVCAVVHDDASIVRLLARHMDRFQIVGVPDPQALLHLVADLRPRAVLTSPQWLADTQRQLGALEVDTPVVCCGLPYIAGHRRSGNLLGYLAKPVQPEAVRAILHDLPGREGMRVLLVDDEPEALRLLERMLATLPRQLTVSRARDGRAALAQMRAQPPDLVLLDLLMPQLNGWEVLEQMQQDAALRHTPVVMISAGDWAEEHLMIEMPLQLARRRPVAFVRGITQIQELLALVDPDLAAAAESSTEPA